MDPAGNLYGTNGHGVIFELSPSGGSWNEQSIYSGGAYLGLTMDAAGNLFFIGPGGRRSGGTVVELSPNGSGGWNSTVIHTFPKDVGGHGPDGTLVIDKGGNVYGITDAGHPHGGGLSTINY
jgi:hypothetical protein